MFKRFTVTGLFCVTAWAQIDPIAPGQLQFLNIHNGDLADRGKIVAVSIARPRTTTDIAPAPIPGVEFFFTPELNHRTISLGIDRVGVVRGAGPECTPNCLIENVYQMTLAEDLATAFDGWGRLGVRIVGHTEEDGFVRVYWSSQPVRASFTQPSFMQTPNTAGNFNIVAESLANNIVSIKVGWKLAVPVSRHINQFEQHVLGPDLTSGGHASCAPTSAAANLAWLNDTGQWADISPLVTLDCQNGRDRCLVNLVGTLMGTQGGGTSGSGMDTGTIVYLLTMGYFRNVQYFLGHPYQPGDPNLGTYGLSPETLLGHFVIGDIMNAGIHNLATEPSLGHVLAVDNISINNDGSANVTLMDPHTVDNPSGKGIYRLIHMNPDGRVDWNGAFPAFGYYSPSSGKAKLDELQWLSFLPFASIFDIFSANDVNPAAAATPASGQVRGSLQKNGRTWTGTFTPPASSPGPWLLMSEVTLESGLKERSFRYVVRSNLPGR
jgi:hypothetical protein